MKNKQRLSRSVLRFFRHMGRIGGEIGGKSKSAAKARASAQNGRLGGRPRKIARSGGDDSIDEAVMLDRLRRCPECKGTGHVRDPQRRLDMYGQQVGIDWSPPRPCGYCGGKKLVFEDS